MWQTPSHDFTSHFTTSIAEPQFAPFCSGLPTLRVRFFSPTPQVAEHSLHSDHSDEAVQLHFSAFSSPTSLSIVSDKPEYRFRQTCSRFRQTCSRLRQTSSRLRLTKCVTIRHANECRTCEQVCWRRGQVCRKIRTGLLVTMAGLVKYTGYVNTG